VSTEKCLAADRCLLKLFVADMIYYPIKYKVEIKQFKFSLIVIFPTASFTGSLPPIIRK